MPPARIIAPLAVLTGVFLALGWVYALTTPPFEKPDEEWHYLYVAYLVNQGRLPPLVVDKTQNPAGQIAGHPPLYYALAATFATALRLDLTQPLPPNNPFWAYPAPGAVPDNKNLFIHSPGERYDADYALRALSLALSAATLPFAYGLARAATGRRDWALLTAAFIALHPQFLFIASSASNDGLATALSTAALWGLLHTLSWPEDWRRWAAFGLAGGLAALAKTNAALLPLVGALTALWLGAQRRSGRVVLMGVTASLGGWLLIVGGWYARNALRFGDPLGVAVHTAAFPDGARLTLADLPTQLSILSITFWGAFGWTNVLWPEWAYTGLSVLQLLALLGVLRWLSRGWPSAGGGVAVLLLFIALIAAALVWWATRLPGTLGRLLFPALAPLMLLLVIGLGQLWRGLPFASLAFLATLALLGPLTILRAYRPPALLSELPASVQRAGFQVGTIGRLAGYQLPRQALTPGAEATAEAALTLCWEAHAPTAEPQTVFVQFVGEGNYLAGARNTYPGLGRYATTLWQPGALFCDSVAVPVNADAPAPARYVVHTGMFDLSTGRRAPVTAADGTPLSVIELGAVKVAGRGPAIPPGASQIQADFIEPIRLRAYELTPLRVGQAGTLTLYWEALGAPSADYTVFVHLLAANSTLVAQADAPPGSDAHAGRYPTSWWAEGETIRDVHTLPLPADLPPGAYQLRVGLYRPDTAERVWLTSGTDAVELTEVKVAP